MSWLVLYVVMTHMMVLTEEEHLDRIHGEEYQQYRKRVPRYIRIKKGILLLGFLFIAAFGLLLVNECWYAGMGVGL